MLFPSRFSSRRGMLTACSNLTLATPAYVSKKCIQLCLSILLESAKPIGRSAKWRAMQ